MAKKTSGRKASAQPRSSRVRSAATAATRASAGRAVTTTSKVSSKTQRKTQGKTQSQTQGKAQSKTQSKTPGKALSKAPSKAQSKTRPAPEPAPAPSKHTPSGPRAATDIRTARGARAAAASAASAAAAAAPALARGRYVYCIIRSSSSLTFGPIGIGGDPTEVYTVNWRDLAAVISDSPPGVQDPTRENVLAHQRVNETVMQEHTVLPMSFGTVFKTKDDIVEFLRSAYDAFADVLNKMENKLEFGLKVLWDRDAVLQEIEQEDEDIRRLKSEIASQKGSTYFARMQYGRLVDAALQARSERYVAEIFAALRDVAVAARSNKPIGDRMIMNAAFLVSRAEEPAFDARVKELGATYDKLTFKYTGPWPPYNFVNIRLKLERA
jgi:Gas vesicle synthesis protein GvpL/GvpF